MFRNVLNYLPFVAAFLLMIAGCSTAGPVADRRELSGPGLGPAEAKYLCIDELRSRMARPLPADLYARMSVRPALDGATQVRFNFDVNSGLLRKDRYSGFCEIAKNGDVRVELRRQ